MAKVPSYVRTGKRAPFPAGTFIGQLTKVTDQWSDDQADLALLLEFRNITPADANSPNVGARPKMQRIQCIFEKQALAEIPDFSDENIPMTLRSSATLVIQLAEAFGVAQKPATDTQDSDFEFEPFLTDLAAGVYNNRTVIFEVANRAWKSKKTGSSGIDDSIKGFKSADADAPATAAAPIDVAAARAR